MRVEYEVISPEILQEWGGGWANLDPEDLVGFACRSSGKLIAIGGIAFCGVDGDCMFEARGRVPLSVHAKARILVRTVTEAGARTLYATCDNSISNAQKWIERFGFECVGKDENDNTLWRLDLNGRPSISNIDGGRDGSQRLRAV